MSSSTSSCQERALQMQCLTALMEKYREGQNVLQCVFMALAKSHDRMPREEL